MQANDSNSNINFKIRCTRWKITEYRTYEKQKILLFLLVLGIFASSCKSVSYVPRGIDVGLKDIQQTPVNAELKVNTDQKVTGISDLQDNKKTAMASAYYNCITTNNIDVVIDPIVKMTKYSIFTKKEDKQSENAKWWKTQYKVEITGYGAQYVKFEKPEEQIKSFENINMDAIVKYKMVTDPNFHKSYYNNQKSNNVFFNSPAPSKERKTVTTNTSTVKLNTNPMPQTLSPISYNEMMAKGKKMRNAGITLFSVGLAIAVPLSFTLDATINSFTAAICCWSVGGALFATGVGLWAGGSSKIKKAKNQNLAIGYNVSPTGAQLAINF